ncbi:MAG: insulinase family protein [Tissierellia bacterium]|nr:insulinase family protein [Tissierellia bacterium]
MYLIDKLDNGIRVVMEKIPYINSVSVGIIIDCGSKNENKNNNGISHFIEHMLFKGTRKRDAKKIAETIDSIGGVLNAFTGKETTIYYAKVLNNHIKIAIDILSDMITNSIFKEEDIEKEKSVILEELYMYLDSPEDLAVELLNKMMFERTSLEHSIIGTEESIKGINRAKILNYFTENYQPENMVISIAGNIDERECIKLLKDYFGPFNSKSLEINKKNESKNIYKFTNKLDYINKDTEQINLCIGMEGLPITSPKMEALMILNNIFGGSMSSRLFQKIREDLGLAYSIETFPSSYKDTGILTLFLGLHPSQILKSIKAIDDEIKNIKENLISREELEKSKEQLKGNYVLGMENTFNRMYEIGKSLLIFNRVFTQEEILNKIDSVDMEDIKEVINIIFNREKFNIAYVGKVENINDDRIKEILF